MDELNLKTLKLKPKDVAPTAERRDLMAEMERKANDQSRKYIEEKLAEFKMLRNDAGFQD